MNLRDLFQKLHEQGFQVDPTTQGHWRATPPDKTKPIVHFSRLKEPRAFRNILSELRKSGFVWDESRVPRPALQLVPSLDAPPSAPAATVPETFAQALRRLRIEEEATIDTVAHLLGVTYQAVSAWELGINVPVREHYETLCDLFPALVLAPTPDIRDIPKPPGAAAHDSVPTEPDIPLTLPPPSLSPLSETNTMAVDPLPPEPPFTPTTKDLVVRFVRLALRVRADEPGAALALLQEAQATGMTLDDVLEMLSR